jgi:heptosyltransferase I
MKGIDGVEFITFDKSRAYSSNLEICRQLRRRHFPIVLHMHASIRANLIARLIDTDIRLGFDRARARDYQWLFTNARIPARAEQHAMDALFGFIETLGIVGRELRWDIPISDEDRLLAEQVCGHDAPVCVISPCSSQRMRNYRNWSAENYAALAVWLERHHGARIILTGGATGLEYEYGHAIESVAGSRVNNLIGKTTLKQLLAIIDRANVLVCPDSGPAHMATAVSTPVVGLYATSNRYRTGPYFSQSLVVDKYPDAVQLETGKPVSALRWGGRVRNPDAMNLIQLDEVTAMVGNVLSGLSTVESCALQNDQGSS